MKPVSPAATYAALLPDLVEAAREVGYVLAPHGSMARDFDLVAVPWTEEAGSAEQLIMRLLAAIGGQLLESGARQEDGTYLRRQGDAPTLLPHGRRAWSIHLVGHSGLYLDVSVMPRSTP